jgi:AcrR family transcriptional regulator
MGRPKEHDEFTRERLLEAAERISGTEGWEAVTVRRVAREAGTSTRAVYALFGSKEGLEQALHEAMFLRLRDLLEGQAPSEDPRADLIELALAYRRWATERPQRYAIAVHRFLGSGSGQRSAEGIEAARAALEVLDRVIRRCQDAGMFLGQEVEAVARQLRAAVHGLAEFENLGLLGPDPRADCVTVVEAVLDGLGASKSTAPATVPAAAS